MNSLSKLAVSTGSLTAKSFFFFYFFFQIGIMSAFSTTAGSYGIRIKMGTRMKFYPPFLKHTRLYSSFALFGS